MKWANFTADCVFTSFPQINSIAKGMTYVRAVTRKINLISIKIREGITKNGKTPPIPKEPPKKPASFLCAGPR